MTSPHPLQGLRQSHEACDCITLRLTTWGHYTDVYPKPKPDPERSKPLSVSAPRGEQHPMTTAKMLQASREADFVHWTPLLNPVDHLKIWLQRDYIGCDCCFLKFIYEALQFLLETSVKPFYVLPCRRSQNLQTNNSDAGRCLTLGSVTGGWGSGLFGILGFGGFSRDLSALDRNGSLPQNALYIGNQSLWHLQPDYPETRAPFINLYHSEVPLSI